MPSELPGTETIIEASDPADHLPAAQRIAASEQNKRQAEHWCHPSFGTATHIMTRDATEVLKMFRNMVFNVYARNRDDHAKNHAFLMGVNGLWSLAPAYDLTFSSGPGGEHSAAIAGEGRNPGMSHLLAVSKGASISDQDAREVIEQVRAAVDRWPEFAGEVQLSRTRTAELDRFLNGNRLA